MKKQITIFLNDYQKDSEVFLFRLIVGLSEEYQLELQIFNGFDNQKLKKHTYCKTSKVRTFTRSLIIWQFYVSLVKCVLYFKNTNRSLRNLFRNAWLLSILHSAKSDLLYFPFISMLRQFADVLPLLTNKKIYSSIRGTDITVTPFLDSSVIEKYKQIYPYIESIHYLAPHILQMARHYGLQHKKEKIIYQGLNFDNYKTETKQSSFDHLRIISIARLHYIKGIEFGILAIRELIQKDIKVSYSIIGDGPQMEYLRYLVKRENMENVVSFLGSLSPDDVHRELLKANILLHPHMVEGLSNTMLEAIALGKKVVTFESAIQQYDVPALKHAIIEVPKYDYKALAGEIIRLNENRSYIVNEEMIEAVKMAFSMEIHITKFCSFFSD